MRPILTRAVAACLIAAPLFASAAGIEVIIDGQTVVFTDVQKSIWFATYVDQAARDGIINGYKDIYGKLTGKFGPSNNVTVGEALKIAIEGAGYDSSLYGTAVDADVGSHWSASYYAVAQEEQFEILALNPRPDRAATRAEVASIFASAFHVDAKTATPVDTRFTDVNTRTAFATSIEALSRDRILSGDTDIHGQATGTFRPTARINRAEVAKLVIAARAKYGRPGSAAKPGDSL
jgi:hypothetical protein